MNAAVPQDRISYMADIPTPPVNFMSDTGSSKACQQNSVQITALTLNLPSEEKLQGHFARGAFN